MKIHLFIVVFILIVSNSIYACQVTENFSNNDNGRSFRLMSLVVGKTELKNDLCSLHQDLSKIEIINSRESNEEGTTLTILGDGCEFNFFVKLSGHGTYSITENYKKNAIMLNVEYIKYSIIQMVVMQ